MRRVVVADQTNVEVCRNLLIEVFEEGEELPVSMAPLALGEHFATGNIEHRKQRVRVVA